MKSLAQTNVCIAVQKALEHIVSKALVRLLQLYKNYGGFNRAYR